MAPKKKKQPHNAFYFFMLDWKEEQRRLGRPIPTALNLIANLCTEDWKSLREEDMKYYKEKAQQSKDEDKANLHNKFTTDGTSFAEVFAREKEESDFRMKMIREIEDTVASVSDDREKLIHQRFYLIHANHYCYWTEKRIYIPCEIAIAEYCIAKGVSDVFHSFVPVLGSDGGRLPIGYLLEGQQIAKRTHQIQMPPFEHAKDTYDEISSLVVSFLQRSGTGEVPPVYTCQDNFNCNYSESTVKDFLSVVEEFTGVSIRTYRLDLLFYHLYNASANLARSSGQALNAIGFPTDTLAQIELDRDIFHYSKNISCEYHEELMSNDTQVSQYCSKSTVQRWGFLMSDYCCKPVGVRLIEGKHCPRGTDTSYREDWTSVKQKQPTRGYGNGTNEGAWGSRSAPIKTEAAPSTAGNPHQVTSPKTAPVNPWNRVAAPPAQQVMEPKREEASGGAAGSYASALFSKPTDNSTRLPKTRGRGEILWAAFNKMQLESPQKEDFPSLGAGRGKRL